MTRKLTQTQDSAMRYLARNRGWGQLSNGMLRTYRVLHELGLVAVTIETPVKGSVTMTAARRAAYPVIPLEDHDADAARAAGQAGSGVV